MSIDFELHFYHEVDQRFTKLLTVYIVMAQNADLLLCFWAENAMEREIYICTYIHIYAYIYVCMCSCINILIYVCIDIKVYAYMYMYMYMYIYIHMNMKYTYIHIYLYIYVYVNMCACICIYMCIQAKNAVEERVADDLNCYTHICMCMHTYI